jgi:uncharacterized protein (TIGR03790 family)
MAVGRAILAGWVVMAGLALAVERPVLWVAGRWLGAQWFATERVALDCLVLAAAGWIVGRLSRASPLLSVLTFAITLCFWNLDPLLTVNVPWLIRLGGDALHDGNYLTSFANTAGLHALLLGSLVAGGILSRPRRIPVSILRAAFLPLFLIAAGTAPAQTRLNDRVLVIYNSAEPDSLAVARYYAMRRGVPQKQLCKITVTTTDAIQQEEYESAVRVPVRKCLEEAGKRKILYIVFSYLTPFKVTSGNRGVSLDQMVADIWDEYLPELTFNLTKPQPYFGDAESEGGVYIPFLTLADYRSHAGTANIYSVWRLDAANIDLAKGLVDKAMAAEASGLRGNGCFDRRYGLIDAVKDNSYGSGDWDLFRAAEFARLAGFHVVEDDHPEEFGSAPAPLRCDDAALYAGWYSLNHYYDAFSWAPGAIGIHLDSYSALNPREGTNWVANALLKGITVTSGAVAEPYLAGLPHPDQLLLYLFQGANAGDAMLRSTRWLKWMIINIGDPLYRPFPKGIAPFNTPGYDRPQLAVLPQEFLGGRPVQLLFHLILPAPVGGVMLTFKSDHPDLVSAPDWMSVVEGTNTAKFEIATRPVTSETVVRLTVSGGGVTLTNTLVLHPPPPRPPQPPTGAH